MRQAAKIISILFHPVFMPLAGAFILLNAGIIEISLSPEHRRTIYLLIALFSILLPVSFLPLLYYWKIIKSFEVNGRKERFIPLICTATALVFLNIMLGRVLNIKLFNAYTFSIAAVSILILFVNISLKISLHTTGLGGITGLILLLAFNYQVNLTPVFIIAVTVSGLVATARLYNKAHTQLEIYLGYMLGFISTYGIMYMLVR